MHSWRVGPDGIQEVSPDVTVSVGWQKVGQVVVRPGIVHFTIKTRGPCLPRRLLAPRDPAMIESLARSAGVGVRSGGRYR